MIKLNKGDLLQKLDLLAMKLRTRPHDFICINGVPDMNVADVRLNYLGKCLDSAIFLTRYGNDGRELGKGEEPHYNDFLRYLSECHDAFDIGRKQDVKKK
jgi:hypothetical protein